MSGFLDTNVIVYGFTGDPMSARSRELLNQNNRVSVQTLNEFTLVVCRRLKFDWPSVITALDRIRTLCPPPQPLTLAIHEQAVVTAQRYQFRIYGAMIVAAALVTGCDTLWTEDMHDGLVIDGRLTLRNPFA